MIVNTCLLYGEGRGGESREVERVGGVSNILRGRHYPIIIYTYIVCDIADGLNT